MIPKKKLQVFVSSTYTDLMGERQAAVEAILLAGHIPAGMELFAAGDQSQMEVIRDWIDESDVFLLILGGRYGTVETESGKSYIELEYEYAENKQKPLFAVVIDGKHLEEKVQHEGLSVIETEHQKELKAFRDKVKSKVVRFWSDVKDIKLAINETLNKLNRRDDLIGWIPGNQGVNTNEVLEQITALTKENSELRERLSETALPEFNGLTFDELCHVLLSSKIVLEDFSDSSGILGNQKTQILDATVDFAKVFGVSEPTLLHLFWVLRRALLQDGINDGLPELAVPLNAFHELGLVSRESRRVASAFTIGTYSLSDTGSRFLSRLKLIRTSENLESSHE